MARQRTILGTYENANQCNLYDDESLLFYCLNHDERIYVN